MFSPAPSTSTTPTSRAGSRSAGNEGSCRRAKPDRLCHLHFPEQSPLSMKLGAYLGRRGRESSASYPGYRGAVMINRPVPDVTLKTRVRDESVGGPNPF